MTVDRPPHRARCAALLGRQAPQQGWTLPDLIDEIHRHCGHSRLRAHRLARGWTLATLIEEIVSASDVGQHLTPSRVSRWERGEEQPSAAYRDALCRVYRTGPVDLGLAHDYRPSPPADSSADGSLVSDGGDIRPAVATTGSADHNTSARALAQADELRRRTDESLSGSTLSDATVAHKEAVAHEYGRIYKRQPVGVFLSNVLADLADVQVLIDRKLPSNQRRDLCAVTARLAGLLSMTMVNLGRYRDAREWTHTARLAADEAGDPALRAWVATRAAVTSLHLGDPLAAAGAAREAEVLTRQNPRDVTAMAWAVLARAVAVMEQPAATRSALHHAATIFDRTTNADAENTAYAFTAGQLHFYTSHALTTIGETRAAWQAQDDALSEFGAHERLDPTLVRLDRALCMVHNGDTAAGAEYASSVLLELPVTYRPPIVMRRAAAIAAAVPASRRALPTVRTLHDVLAIERGTAVQEPLRP